MDKEKLYKAVIAILLGIIVVMALIVIIRKPSVPVKGKVSVPAYRKPVARAGKGKIAIIIDDVGYTSSNLELIEGFTMPLTFSVLPGLGFSAELSHALSKKGFQVILHLPMEPLEKMNLETNTLLTTMDEAQLRAIIDEDIKALPNVRGVSNHMGSKATEDARLMAIVLDEIKKKRLFFLDSFVTANSVAKTLAQQQRVRFVKRDVFLDNNADPAYIRQQLNQLKEKAREKGAAVGIGHDRRATLEVLKEVLPELAKEGYTFIFVSELAK